MNLRPLGYEEGERCLSRRAASRSCRSPVCCLSPSSQLGARVDVVPGGLVSNCVSRTDRGGGLWPSCHVLAGTESSSRRARTRRSISSRMGRRTATSGASRVFEDPCTQLIQAVALPRARSRRTSDLDALGNRPVAAPMWRVSWHDLCRCLPLRGGPHRARADWLRTRARPGRRLALAGRAMISIVPLMNRRPGQTRTARAYGPRPSPST